MYCNKCGKEISDNEKFCVYCGEKVDAQQIHIKSDSISNGNVISTNFAINSVTGIISTILVAVLAVAYFVVAIRGFSGNKNAFEFVGDGCRVFGYLLHWGICLWVVCDCFLLIFPKVHKRQKTASWISLFVVTVIIWIGKMIWNEATFEELPLVFYRIFNTYGELTVISFILLIIVLVCNILSLKSE